MRNQDSFRDQPADYRSYRPQYPAALYAYLAARCATSGAALDCATGSGQAAVGLAAAFDRVAAGLRPRSTWSCARRCWI